MRVGEANFSEALMTEILAANWRDFGSMNWGKISKRHGVGRAGWFKYDVQYVYIYIYVYSFVRMCAWMATSVKLHFAASWIIQLLEWWPRHLEPINRWEIERNWRREEEAWEKEREMTRVVAMAAAAVAISYWATHDLSSGDQQEAGEGVGSCRRGRGGSGREGR